MALALVMVVAPISALLVISHLQNLQAQRRSQVQNIAALGDSLTASVDGFARDLESVSFAASIALANGNPITQQADGAYLHNLRDNYGSLSLVFVTDLNGKVLASEPQDLTGIDVSADKYVKALKTGAETVWTGVPPSAPESAVSSSPTNVGTPLMVHGRVVRNSAQQPIAFLFIAFYPSQLAARLPEDMPPDSNVSFIDDQGLVLYTTSKDPKVPETIGSSPVFIAASGGQQVRLEGRKSPVDSGARYGSFERVPRTGWVVGFTRPASAIDGPFQSRLTRDVGIMALLIVAGIAMMVLIASHLTKPLSRLSGAAAAIARGEQPVVPVDAADADMRKLERAMGTMSRAIGEREERLLAQTRIMETLERVGETLATELDFEDAVASIGIAALQLSQARTVGIYYQEGGRPDGETRLIGVSGEPFPLTSDDPLVRRTLSGEVLDVSEVGVFPGALPPQPLPNSTVVHSFLGIPIKSRFGEVLGGLFLLHSRQNAFDERQKLLAVGLARRASIVVENARLYSESQETQEELRNASMAKSEFIGVMSHELRTPITTIFGGARLLRSKRNNIGQEAVDEMIVSIEEEAERLYRLVENLLTLARTDLYEHINIDILSIVRVVEQAVKQFSARKPGRPLQPHMPESLPLVLGEPGYIHLVLHNLITNADKYSETGRPIDIDIEKQDAEVVIKVMDRGTGVAPDEIDQIFESFYRSQRTAKLAGGKGLGLTVCKRLIEAMSGRIWAEHREGGGLVVAFALPAVPDETEDDIDYNLEAEAAVSD